MNGKDKITKMNNMEIKVGDKVRVREDAPKIFLLGWYGFIGNVVDIEDSYTKIECNDCTLVIPTKYLVKVDAEKKEAKFKKGDRVKFKNIYELQKVKDKSFRWMLTMFASKEATITAVEDNGFYRVDIDPSIGGINDDMIECKVEPTEPEYKYQVGQKVKSAYANEILTIKERCGRASHDNVYKVEEYAYTWNECELQPCTEPTEQTEAEKKINVGSIKIPVEVDLSDSYWDAYAADLAKELALKVANKFNDPKEAAEYAVSVAKAVVEGLKRK